MQTTSAIVRFYGGADTDNLGRKLEEMWEWTDDKLEGIHNYIQWMFPTNERSASIAMHQSSLMTKLRCF
jgi:hypothetical protein